MRVVFCMADSFRRDHLSCYGPAPWGAIHTPSLDRFARTAAVFDRAHIRSFPTVPNRRDLLLGRGDKGMPFNRWRALDPDEATFLKPLAAAGVPSMLISDTQNNLTGAVNLQRDYTAWALNRGQEGDRCWLDVRVPLDYPVPPHLIRYREEMWRQVLVNRARRRLEADWFAPGTYAMALRWLEENRARKDFFLWIDTFDPHEPWDPPQHYIDRYDPGYEGRIFDAPTYGVRRDMGITDRELQHIRARYAAEVTMVDHCFGGLLERLDSLGMQEDTTVIFTSDHGTCFDGPGDFGILQKAWMVGADGMLMSAGRPAVEPRRFLPLSLNIARVPLLIRIPGQAPCRLRSVVQPWDVTATLLDLFGVAVPARITGMSLLPLIRGEEADAREHPVVVGTGGWGGGGGLAQVITDRWLYAVWRGERSPHLTDLQADPEGVRDLAAEKPDVCAELHEHVLELLRGQGLPESYAEGYVTAPSH